MIVICYEILASDSVTVIGKGNLFIDNVYPSTPTFADDLLEDAVNEWKKEHPFQKGRAAKAVIASVWKV